MLLASVADLLPFTVIGVEVTPLFGPLEVDYEDMDRAAFRAALAAVPGAAAGSARQGVVVRPPAGHVLRPHFHAVPQYQVFYAGEGRVGRDDVGPVTVHYADPWTPYGPIVAGAEGLAYAVLRPRPDGGAHWMPDERALLAGARAGRHFTVRAEPGAGPARAALAGPEGGHPAAVTRVRLAPGEPLADAPGEGTATFVAVVAGSVRAGREYAAPSFGYLTPAPVSAVAGAHGADVLLLVA